jgi:hypothetical protein
MRSWRRHGAAGSGENSVNCGMPKEHQPSGGVWREMAKEMKKKLASNRNLAVM